MSREVGEDDGDDTPAIDLAALLKIDRRRARDTADRLVEHLQAGAIEPVTVLDVLGLSRS